MHFRNEQKIEFRDVKDFNKVLHSHSVVPHKPGSLATIGASTLIFVDGSKKPYEVYWLDLSESKPKLTAGKHVIHTQLNEVSDISFGQVGDKHLLIVAARQAGLFAYNTETDKLEWKVDGKVSGREKALDAHGVTTDEHGHLFVADYNNECIQMFSTSEGQYLGCLIKGVEIIGVPARVYCSAETSSLLVACWQGTWHLQLINIQY